MNNLFYYIISIILSILCGYFVGLKKPELPHQIIASLKPKKKVRVLFTHTPKSPDDERIDAITKGL